MYIDNLTNYSTIVFYKTPIKHILNDRNPVLSTMKYPFHIKLNLNINHDPFFLHTTEFALFTPFHLKISYSNFIDAIEN